MTLDAILWDYDGTLVNSVPKNIDITKDILSIVAPHLSGNNLPKWLLSEALYHEANHGAKNWQELYIDYYGLTHAEMIRAGSLWAEHQEKNKTDVVLFDGIKHVVEHFAEFKQGICSQNSQKNISQVLKANNIDEQFQAIVGYNDVPSSEQKPHSFGGIKCIESIFGHTDIQLMIYIGDHEADTQFARNIQSALGSDAKVVSIAAGYSRSEPEHWDIKPDHIAHTVDDLLSIIGLYTK